jgi:cell division protein ZapB
MLRKERGKPLDTCIRAPYNRVTPRVAHTFIKASPKNRDEDSHPSTPCHSGEFEMSFEVFEKLEAKVQQAVDTITLLQMEIEELKEKNNGLAQEVQQAQSNHEELVRENSSLKEQQHVWQERLHALLGKMEEV